MTPIDKPHEKGVETVKKSVLAYDLSITFVTIRKKLRKRQILLIDIYFTRFISCEFQIPKCWIETLPFFSKAQEDS